MCGESRGRTATEAKASSRGLYFLCALLLLHSAATLGGCTAMSKVPTVCSQKRKKKEKIKQGQAGARSQEAHKTAQHKTAEHSPSQQETVYHLC